MRVGHAPIGLEEIDQCQLAFVRRLLPVARLLEAAAERAVELHVDAHRAQPAEIIRQFGR